MAQLYEGHWRDTAPAAEEIGDDGRFRRIDSPLREWISSDPAAEFPAEAGRYHLWVAAVCPWAARTTAFRVLKGLEDVISISWARPGLPAQGWVFDEGPDGERPEDGYPLHCLYVEHDPRFTGKVTVPTLWDKTSRRIVNNESSEIIRMLNSAFDGITGNRRDFYPEPLRGEIERWNALIYPTLNNGVYRAGFAGTQAAYDEAVGEVFAALDAMDEHLEPQPLSRRRVADRGRLARVHHAGAVRRRLPLRVQVQCPEDRRLPGARAVLARALSVAGIAATVDLALIKYGYWFLADRHHVVARGPEIDLATPHGRERLPGRGVMERAD
jgi:putative glutathione S-transferase